MWNVGCVHWCVNTFTNGGRFELVHHRCADALADATPRWLPLRGNHKDGTANTLACDALRRGVRVCLDRLDVVLRLCFYLWRWRRHQLWRRGVCGVLWSVAIHRCDAFCFVCRARSRVLTRFDWRKVLTRTRKPRKCDVNIIMRMLWQWVYGLIVPHAGIGVFTWRANRRPSPRCARLFLCWNWERWGGYCKNIQFYIPCEIILPRACKLPSIYNTRIINIYVYMYSTI